MPKYYTPTKEEIRALRNKLNITQGEMAEVLKCSLNCISKWEQGVNVMPAMVWNAAEIIAAQVLNANKQTKLTAYEQRQLDKQEEAVRKQAMEDKYNQALAERERAEMARREELYPEFDDLMIKLRKRFGNSIREFENCERASELEHAIYQMRNLYEQNKAEVDRLNAGLYDDGSNLLDGFNLDRL